VLYAGQLKGWVGAWGAAMSFRWEVLADPTSDGQELWTIMEFDEPFSQESIERAFCSGYSQNYTYQVTHQRSWGTLTRKYSVCFLDMTQDLLFARVECKRRVRRISMTPPTPLPRCMLFST
jgi:hypothetical protein